MKIIGWSNSGPITWSTFAHSELKSAGRFSTTSVKSLAAPVALHAHRQRRHRPEQLVELHRAPRILPAHQQHHVAAAEACLARRRVRVHGIDPRILAKRRTRLRSRRPSRSAVHLIRTPMYPSGWRPRAQLISMVVISDGVLLRDPARARRTARACFFGSAACPDAASRSDCRSSAPSPSTPSGRGSSARSGPC